MRQLPGGGALRRPHIAARCPYLWTAFEKQPIQQQQEHGADNRHDPAGDVVLAGKDATDPGANQCACDAKQNRNDATARIPTRHQQLCDRADDKTAKNDPND